MPTPHILALVSDLFFIPNIQTVARHLGYTIHFVEQPISKDEFDTLLTEQPPALLIVDTNNHLVPWADWVTDLKTDDATQHIPVLAFGSHKDVDTMKKAKQAGADVVVARSKFTAELPDLIQKYINSATNS
ncbi:MAG: hypothetical protein DWQ07_12385 [Chloroflexi bacterium]|nr:MAG: hypothetical protein DWQ07_12385 [Chloroflexota bacterium]MBL1196837.1 hypothetical protein [Chloroflexota bacterium]NOH14132.1 hypothetical protein [Chloroflexota bacterium]